MLFPASRRSMLLLLLLLCAEQCLGLYVSARVGAGDFNFIFNRSRKEVGKKMGGEEQILPAEARAEWMMWPTRSKHAAPL